MTKQRNKWTILAFLCGLFLVSRQYQHREVTEGGTFGWGNGWKLETVELSERQKTVVMCDLHRLKFADTYYGELNHYGMY